MNEVEEHTEEDLLESMDELERLLKNKLEALDQKNQNELERRLGDLEKKFDLIKERNQRVTTILDRVIAELKELIANKEIKCPQ